MSIGYRLRSRATLLLSLLLAVATPAHAAYLGSVGTVNTTTAGAQSLNSAKTAANGDRLVLWQDNARGNLTFMQRYDAAGTPLHPEWLAGNGVTDGALNKVGQYVLVSVEADGAGKSVYAQVFDRAGQTVVAKFKVNSLAFTNVYGAIVAMNESGRFAVAWTVGSGSTTTVYARNFTAAGVATAGEVALAAGTVNQAHDSIAMDDTGNYAIVFRNMVGTPDVWMRRFNSSGAALGSAFVVNTYTTSSQVGGAIAMNGAGAAVVAWESYNQDGTGWSIYAQRFANTGAKVGSEFRVNSITSGEQQGAGVGMMEDGKFSVSWTSNNNAAQPTPNNLYLVYVRDFSATGTAVATEAVAASEPMAQRTFLAMDKSGHSLLAWQSYDSVPQLDVRALRHRHGSVAAMPVLASGVPVTGLSGTVGSWKYYRIVIPSGATMLTLSLTGTGEADIYGRYAGIPTLALHEVAGTNPGSNQSFSIGTPPPGTYIIGIHGYAAYSNVALTATVQ